MQLLRNISLSSNNNNALPPGSPLVGPTLSGPMLSGGPVLRSGSLADENAAGSTLAFPYFGAARTGSCSPSALEAQPSPENVSTPLSAKQQQPLRRGVFATATPTPFNGSPSFSAHAKKSSLSIQHSENPSLRSLGATASGAGIATAGLVSTSHGSPAHSADGVLEITAAGDAVGDADGNVRNGELMHRKTTSMDATTTVEIMPASSKPWEKRHLFRGSASKIFGSRRSSSAGHGVSMQGLEVRSPHAIY